MIQTCQNLRIFLVTLFVFLSLPAGNGSASVPEVMDLKIQADHLLKQGQIERAIPLYETVLQKDGRFANAYYNLATAYYLQNELEKALENLEAFVRLRPHDAEALYNLGCLKLRKGAFQEAWKCFLKAEHCPCTRSISTQIKKALHFSKGLQSQDPETQKLIAYLLTI